MKKRIVLTVVLLTMFCLTSYTFAAWAPRLDGRPYMFHPGNSQGYFLWQDKDGLHLRTTTPGTTHIFRGTIHTDGIFEDVSGRSLEGIDYLLVNDDHNKLTYKFTTDGSIDGFDVHVSDGSYVTLNLSMDGEPIDTDEIFIGKDGWHPGSNKFTFRHENNRENYDDNQTVIIVGGHDWWHFHNRGWHGHWRH